MIQSAQKPPFLAAAPKVSPPPKRLRAAGARFWTSVVADFLIEPHQEQLLLFASIQVDRADQASRRFRKATSDRQRERALASERAAMRAHQMLRRELAIDSAAKEARGPRAGGRYA